MLTTPTNAFGAGQDLATGTFFTSRLQTFLSPLLVFLDQLLDQRLVSTFSGLCSSIIRLRNHSTGLYLSELGSYLLSGAQAPAGTKRISNLLRSAKWQEENLIHYLGLQAQVYAQQLQLLKKELVLLLWDESVQEKPESLQSEGLCAVRSSKAQRLLRIKKGYYEPPTRKPVHVPGLRWVGLLLAGLTQPPQLARFRWWSSRQPQFSSLAQVRYELLQWARALFGRTVLHVFDRGYAAKEWLGLLLNQQDRFLLRWPSAYQLRDGQGRLKRASLFSVGRRATSSQKVWDMARKCLVKRSLLWQRCWHVAYADCSLTLIICRPGRKGRQPWYLLTNQAVANDKQAWQLVKAYARRWQIEQSFRFSKSELAMESCRLWFWNNKMKLLQIVALVYAFLLTLLAKELQPHHQKILKGHLHSISFLDNMPNTALTSPVNTPDSIKMYNITFRAGIFKETISEWATQKEITCFDQSVNPDYSIKIEAGTLDAFLYVLLHEATHVVDAVVGITPHLNDKDELVKPTSFTKNIWYKMNVPTNDFIDSLLEKTRFRSGKKVAVNLAPKVYKNLSKTPFASLYGMASWSEDIAELESVYHLTKKMKQPFYVTVIKDNTEICRFEPMSNKLVKKRFRYLKVFYTA